MSRSAPAQRGRRAGRGRTEDTFPGFPPLSPLRRRRPPPPPPPPPPLPPPLFIFSPLTCPLRRPLESPSVRRVHESRPPRAYTASRISVPIGCNTRARQYVGLA
eukprot:8506014-Pyramimonas_sp.AAC.1